MTSPIDQGEALAALAAKLTKAQRDHLSWKGTRIGVVASNAQVADRLCSMGLAVKTPGFNSGRMLDWTELGLALREHIQTNMEGER